MLLECRELRSFCTAQPAPNGGTTWDAADEPDPDWHNPVYVRVWVPTGNRIWTATTEADHDWVNAEYEQRWV